MNNITKNVIAKVEKYSNPEKFRELKDEYIRSHHNRIGVVKTPFKNIEVYTS